MKQRLNRAAALAPALLLCFGIAACDSQGTKEVKQEAKAIDRSYKAEADLVEASARNAPDPERAKRKAQALRDQGEVERKYLVKEAEKTQADTH